MNALDYLLKANLYGLLFISCYWLFLRRHTFFTLNRAYLLVSAVLSLVLPLASLPTQTVETLPTNWPVPVGVITLPVSAVSTAPAQISQVSTGFDWETIVLITYGLIAIVLVLHLAIRVGRLLWLIRRSERQVHTNYVLVETPKLGNSAVDAPTFSFFRYLVLNPADRSNDLIIQHELVHIRQYHSADVLGLALLRALFWACPALWFIDKLLRQVHEFLADREARQPSEYARFLLEYTFGLQPDSLTNGFFNPSLLKQRIQMLFQKTTPRWALGKYMLIIPLVLSLLAMTTAQKDITSVVDQFQKDGITVTGKVTGADGKSLPGAVIIIKGKEQSSSTNAEGQYTLTNVPKNAVLTVNFIGFDPQTVLVKGRTSIHVMMTRSVALDEVVVTAGEPLSKGNVNGAGSDEKALPIVEQQPQFPGGVRALTQYLNQKLQYPARARKANVDGRVIVQFVVSQTGDIEQLRILKSIGFGCDEEAVRVVSQMPKWIPGKQQGQAVSVVYNLPIQFSLEKKAEDKRTGQVMPESKAGSERPRVDFVDNSKNARFALYNDVHTSGKERYAIPLPDSLKP
ncbi:MAG: TonB family protein, partial [Cytophagaceae bacterium]